MKKNSNKKPKFKASHIVEKFYKVLEFLLSKLGPLKREFKIIVNKLKPLTFRAIDSAKDFSTKIKCGKWRLLWFLLLSIYFFLKNATDYIK